MKPLILTVSALVLTTALGALAQAPATPPPAAPPAAPATATTPPAGGAEAKAAPLQPADKSFLKQSLESIFFLTNISDKHKAENAKSEGVKKLAAELNKEMNAAWGELAGLATNSGEKIPEALAGGDKSKVSKLTKSGDKFDKEFLELAGKEIKRLERVAKTGDRSTNATIKTTATSLATRSGTHLSTIETLEKELSKAK